ncbi:MAG: tyrosine-protein phosphatase [Dehalococcoidia bacterium]
MFYDIHCHILPGIDDGARDMNESVQMALLAEQDNIEIAVATPHHIPRSNLSGKSEIENLVANTNNTITKNKIQLTVISGQENKITNGLLGSIEKEDSLLIGSTNYILVEAPFTDFPDRIYRTLSDLLDNNMYPILAHPERNLLIQQDLGMLKKFKDKGILIQSNTGSFIGHYGNESEVTVKNMLENNLVDVVASDAHTSSGIRVPNMSKGFNIIQNLMGENKAFQLTSENPHNIILGKTLI